MRPSHFERLAPRCPVCRAAGRERRLELAASYAEAGGHLVEGVLCCTEAGCRAEFPVVDGIPLVIPDLRERVARDLGQLLAREDLSEPIESLLGDCSGPGSPFDVTRQQLSSYGWDHWGDLDPEEPPGEPRPGSVLRLLDEAVARARGHADGPVLVAGCAVGRAAFALAERTDEPVLGVDLHLAMLRVAAGALRRGRVRYPRRRVGLVYDRREFPVALAGAARVDFWACDAAALPFAADTFGAVVALNLLDSVASPRETLAEIARCLAPGGRALLACPYDWSPAATPVEAWIGGHSQRGAERGAAEPLLRALLGPGDHPAAVEGLAIVAEEPALPWRVRLHDRSAVDYRVHLVVAEKKAPG